MSEITSNGNGNGNGTTRATVHMVYHEVAALKELMTVELEHTKYRLDKLEETDERQRQYRSVHIPTFILAGLSLLLTLVNAVVIATS